MSITGKRRVGFSPEVVKSERPLIAIVGSIDESRIYDPPLARVDKARQACEQLGCELATRGCRIVVYSNAPRFIEAHVVRGYLVVRFIITLT